MQTLLTENFVKQLSFSNVSQKFISDQRVIGLRLVIGKGTKTFTVQRKMRGKILKKTLGRYPLVKVNQARKLAVQVYAAWLNETGSPFQKEQLN